MRVQCRVRPSALVRTVLVAATCASAAGAFAAHPLLTEDPGTQGTGRFELELGFSAAQGDPVFSRGYDVQPQFSAGVIQTLDFIVQGTLSGRSPQGSGSVHGPGDTAMDTKWRFLEFGKLALAVRAGIDLPTGDFDKGLSTNHVGIHAVAIAGWTEQQFSLLFNAGYLYLRQEGARANIGRVTAAWLTPADAPLQAFVEAAAQSNANPARSAWPAVVRAGLIYSLTNTLDLDIGYQARLNAAAPRQVVLAGATLRW